MKEIFVTTLSGLASLVESSVFFFGELSRRAWRLFPCEDTCYATPRGGTAAKCGSGECPDGFAQDELNPRAYLRDK